MGGGPPSRPQTPFLGVRMTVMRFNGLFTPPSSPNPSAASISSMAHPADTDACAMRSSYSNSISDTGSVTSDYLEALAARDSHASNASLLDLYTYSGNPDPNDPENFIVGRHIFGKMTVEGQTFDILTPSSLVDFTGGIQPLGLESPPKGFNLIRQLKAARG
ncbi:hypothetical protein B0H14DRAFT_2671591 [Mycena olivaceomarginata]|nr:hypothetical protein B0H14DRAFT_2671591 [Mycena olivaceomarginata]